MGKIVVLGSLNMDLVMSTERLPQVGETILGESIDYLVGGKGSNQAVAASRMGNHVTLLGCVGTDTFGEKLLKHLGKETLDLSSVKQEESIFTGIANIFKMPQDNAIVVIPGANYFVDESYVRENEDIIRDSDVLLSQLEIPLKTVKKGFQLAKEYKTVTILNPAPFSEGVGELLEYVDYITPNETEFEGLVGYSLKNADNLESAMLEWELQNQTKLIVTRGDKGASFIENNQVVTLSSPKVNVVDTTGAGDTFNGILATELANQIPLREAVQKATIGASLSVKKFGAQAGMPTAEQIDLLIK